MRLRAIAFAAGILFTAFAGAASALPRGLEIDAPSDLIQVQMRCDASRCIDQRTGVYSQSTCDRYGCRPLGGPVGRVGGSGRGYDGGPRGGYDGGYEDRPRRRGWDDDGRGYRGGGGFNCNSSRCIEAGTGRVWESTCDRYGCRPLRPARGQRW